MDNSSKVSIVIACYNDPDVGIAITSALEQTYLNKEIIVIDDGSSNEEVRNIINNFEHKVDHILFQENRGQSIARNNGIKISKGKYILNLDSDDYFEESFVKKAVQILERDDEVKIVTCKARRFDKNGIIDIFTPLGGNLKNFLFSNAALGSSMFRRRDWEMVKGYEENLPILGFEDWEFYINLLKTGGTAYVLPEVLFNYQVRENSTTARIKGNKSILLKHIILKHQELYLSNFEELIDFFVNGMQKLNKEKLNRENSIEYRLGKKILIPFRLLKNVGK